MGPMLFLFIFLSLALCFIAAVQREDACWDSEFSSRFWAIVQLTCFLWPLWAVYGIYRLVKWMFTDIISDLKEG